MWVICFVPSIFGVACPWIMCCGSSRLPGSPLQPTNNNMGILYTPGQAIDMIGLTILPKPEFWNWENTWDYLLKTCSLREKKRNNNYPPPHMKIKNKTKSNFKSTDKEYAKYNISIQKYMYCFKNYNSHNEYLNLKRNHTENSMYIIFLLAWISIHTFSQTIWNLDFKRFYPIPS